jgi:hypothetical protein
MSRGKQKRTEEAPVACSLGTGELERRVEAIGSLGSESLISHEAEPGRHILRFRGGAGVGRRLEEIVAAESECCPFLALLVEERDGLLVLSISAPEYARFVADQLAAAFTRPA